MSIVSWLLKSKSDMAKKNTPCVKLGKYTLTSHAQNRVADPTRKTKKEMSLTTCLQGHTQ